MTSIQTRSEKSWNKLRDAAIAGNLEQNAFFGFLKKLYEGNGWTVSLSRLKGETGSDMLLSYPSRPTEIALIVHVWYNSKPVDFLSAKQILRGFETVKADAYHCTQFAIVSQAGFDSRCERLAEFNLLLHDAAHIHSLIRKYSEGKRREPEIQLFAHNHKTYTRVNNLFASSRKVAVVQATGTGKSYLIAKLLADHKDVPRLVLAPSHYIIGQIMNHILWDSESITFMTYAASMFLTAEKIKMMKVGFIVLDEFHRCGAEEWGKGVQEIFSAFPRARVFGTSATPVRYLDGGRDMSSELFDGNVAENLSLSQSIVKKILPMPKYVTALYSLHEEIEALRQRINKSPALSAEKKHLLHQLDVASISWEKSRGIPVVLAKHIGSGMRKLIVFCREGEHLYETEQTVSAWFTEAFPGKKVKVYRVISNETARNENLKNFIDADEADCFHLLFSIDMLNEGMHIDNVNGVILLRPTESPTIFYQQIGRCLKVGFKGQPVIFDFVNNFRSIRTQDFLGELEHFRQLEKGVRYELGLEEICPPFGITDETKEITEVFGQISFFADSWEVMFKRLMEYKERFGDCRVPFGFSADKKLAMWVTNQRSAQFHMLPERRAKLDSIGFVWNANDAYWEDGYIQLKAYFEKNGHCRVTPEINKSLASWCATQRSHNNTGKLPASRKKRLEKLQFDWDPMESQWEEKFERFRILMKSKAPNAVLNEEVGHWITVQRTLKRKGRLDADKVSRLENAGMVWNPLDEAWKRNYGLLAAYRRRVRHCNIPALEYKELAHWCTKQRQLRNSGRLSADHRQQLDVLGFDWSPKQNQWFAMYNKLAAFYEQTGHSIIPASPEYSDLYGWCARYRQKKNIDRLPDEKKRLLDMVEFVWDQQSMIWQANYERIKAFKERYGHLRVTEKGDKELIAWCRAQRAGKEKLMPHQVEKLVDLGFDFEPLETQWLNLYRQLQDFKSEFGHTNVPLAGKWFKLAQWVLRHRNYPAIVKPEKKALLDKLDFEWKHDLVQRWEKRFAELLTFRARFGHIHVPSKGGTKSLSKWLVKNIRLKQAGQLSKELSDKMEKEGITELPKRNGRYYEDSSFRNEILWEECYNLLVQFKNEHGHCSVPRKHNKLDQWTTKQRRYFREGKLSQQKAERLQALGFALVLPKVDAWEKNFGLLLKFTTEHGHTNVPKASGSLYAWKLHQLKKMEQRLLRSDKASRLNELLRSVPQ